MPSQVDNLGTLSRGVRFISHTWIVLLSGLLISTSALKILGLRFSAVSTIGILSAPRWQIAAACWELLLAFLLLRRYDVLSRNLSLATFAVFTTVSAYSGIVGISTCGCFGKLSVNPWWVFALDLFVIAGLMVIRPTHQHRSEKATRNRSVMVAVLLCFAIPLLVLRPWSLMDRFVAELRGESLSLGASHIDFGAGSVDDEREGSVEITNHSLVPVRIVGGASDCRCTTTDGLPVTIPSGETLSVMIALQIPPSQPGYITRKVWLWTDCPAQPKLAFEIGYRLVPQP